MKYLILLAVVAVIWWVWSKRARGPRAASHAPTREKEVERIVACAHCGVHIPESESIGDDSGVRYCCAAHRDARGGGPR
ncbi:MAG: hypothetical protein FIB06_13355 [Betaproteobacteria bacterium]|nr:hypothetical protein [Betaproteobacteria bacterium]